MGSAMLKAWARCDFLQEAWVIQPSLTAPAAFAEYSNVHFAAALSGVREDFIPDLVVFAVKPQTAAPIVAHYTQFKTECLYLSVMSGISFKWLGNILGGESAFVRLMPNLAAKLGQSMSLAVSNDHATPRQREMANHLGKALGSILWLDSEHLLEAGTPISGSGPAYYFLLTECLEQAAIDLGFGKDAAKQLAEQTLLGSALLLQNSDQSAENFRQQVSSKGGITLAALEVLNQPPLVDKVKLAIAAAIKREQELAQ